MSLKEVELGTTCTCSRPVAAVDVAQGIGVEDALEGRIVEAECPSEGRDGDDTRRD
jgi:hypothetical protein